MAAECAFILPSGKKCRCTANRHHKFCRHHGAPSRRKTLPTGDRPWSRLACWRNTVRALPTYPREDIPGEVLCVLYALLENNISDRTAGRILRSLFQRFGGVPFVPETAAQQAPGQEAPAREPGIPNITDLDELDRLVAQLTRKQNDHDHGRP